MWNWIRRKLKRVFDRSREPLFFWDDIVRHHISNPRLRPDGSASHYIGDFPVPWDAGEHSMWPFRHRLIGFAELSMFFLSRLGRRELAQIFRTSRIEHEDRPPVIYLTVVIYSLQKDHSHYFKMPLIEYHNFSAAHSARDWGAGKSRTAASVAWKEEGF